MFSTNTKRLLKSFIAVFTIDCFPPSCDVCKSELVLSLVYFHELTTLSTTAILLLANVFSICNLCYARNNLSSLFQPPRFSKFLISPCFTIMFFYFYFFLSKCSSHSIPTNYLFFINMLFTNNLYFSILISFEQRIIPRGISW